SSGKELRRLAYSEQIGPPRGICFSPDGRSVLLDFGAEQMALYEVATGRERRFFGRKDKEAEPPLDGLSAQMFDLAPQAFSPDGRLVAQGALHGNVGLWEVSSGRKLGEFEGHRGDVLAVVFSHDGKRLASGSTDTTILIWDVTKFASVTKSA